MTSAIAGKYKYIDEKRKETSFRFSDLEHDPSRLRISTDRYICREFQARERESIWMRAWQVAGRVDELPAAGDWKEYTLFDQSYVIVRGRDEKLRGFANVCPHRGNQLCVGGSGHSAVLLCPFHNWTFNLDGSLRGVARPDLVGPINKDELGLPPVSVDTFAGFIFLNPNPDAKPLAEYLGQEVMDYLAPYHLDEMVPVGLHVRDSSLECNWKAVIDGFQESYHIPGLHPQMGVVFEPDPAKSRSNFIGDHHLTVAPFEVKAQGFTAEQAVEGIRSRLPATYHGAAQVMPFFEARVAAYRNKDGKLELPAGVTAYTLLQQATREHLASTGMPVSGLSDEQMTDHYGWLLFPNLFISAKAGEATCIAPVPHPDGDPNKCVWTVTRLAWLPPEQREAARTKLVEIKERGEYKYFEVLQQDYDGFFRQHKGLRNTRLKYLTLAQEEGLIAKFHSEVDKYVEGKAEL